MKASIKQALTNERDLRVKKIGYGHWRISCKYRDIVIHAVTIDSIAIDDYNSDPYEKKDGRNRVKQGYEALINHIIRANKG